MNQKRFVVLGEGAAGMTAAEVLRRSDPNAAITIVSDDPNPAYFRAALTNYLLGELREEQVWAVPPSFYADYRLERLLARVNAVDTRKRNVWLSSGGMPLVYDSLLIATGARARPPAFEGADLPGVGTLRTLQDVRWVMDLLALGGLRRAVVIGGGPLALEWAHALRERGAQVTMVIRETRLMGGALDNVGSDLLISRMRKGGIDLRLGEEVVRAQPNQEMRVGAVTLRSGQTLPCDLCAVAIGVVCNTELLANSGVNLGPRGGVVVDERLRTSVEAVYAAGDVAEIGGKLDQKWEPARLQGLVAAGNMAGGDRRYAPGAPYFATRLYDLDFASVGNIEAVPPGPGVLPTEEIVVPGKSAGRMSYRKLVLRGGRLVGTLLLGEREERVRMRGRAYKQLIDGKVDINAVKNDLLDPAFDLQGWLKGKALIAKPQPTRSFAIPPQGVPRPPRNAEMRGTQQLDMRDFVSSPHAAAASKGRGPSPAAASVAAGPSAAQAAAAAAVAATAFAPVSGGPMPAARDGALLSIGLRAPSASASAAVAGPPAWLEGAGGKFDLSAPVISIGRDTKNQVVLQDRAVSHLHAQITRHGGSLYLRDVGSRGGTFVNGVQVTVPHALRHGDRLRLGGTDLLFQSPTATPPAGGGAYAQAPPGFQRAQTAQPPPGAPPGHHPGTPRPGAAHPSSGYGPPPAEAAQRQPCLEVRGGPLLGLGFALTGASVTIGRDPASTIRIDDLSVSRRHALLTLHEGHWFLSDLHSSRGTFRNGERLPPGQNVPLREGDKLQVGESILELVMRPMAR